MKIIPAVVPLFMSIGPIHAWQLHEWGTFTTVAGSDGVLLTGLEREEEPLPPFVHAQFGLENGQSPDMHEILRILKTHGTPGITPPNSKGLGSRPVSGVTVKMETPVIYFHSDAAFKARVSVGFEGGVISQWYPDRSGGETLSEPTPSADPVKNPTPYERWKLDFSKPRRGSIEWNVDVLSPAESPGVLTFKPDDSVNWLRARVPEANIIRTASGETENYLFYRGIGNFTPGLQTSVSSDETLHLSNHTGGDVSYMLVFEQNAGKIHWHGIPGGLKSGNKVDVPETALAEAGDGFPAPIYQSMKSGLTASGLLSSEADAMIQTWWRSYFGQDGLRVFWIVPAAVTAKVLPLTVSPAPDQIVRTLVGRSEVLRPRQEVAWLAQSRVTGDQAWPWKTLIQSDRFGLAVQERVKVLEKEHAATAGK